MRVRRAGEIGGRWGVCRFGRLVAWACLAGIAGCADPDKAAMNQVIEAERDYRNSRYRAAESKLNRYLRQYPESPQSAEAYCLRALCNVQLSDKRRAESDARRCIELSRHDDLTASAHATIATLLYESNQTREALMHFEWALRGLPDKPPADLLRYRYALCLQREGRWRQARLEFASMRSRHAGSTLSQHAQRMMDWPHDYYSIQCGAFRDRASASTFASKLTRSGLSGAVESQTRDGESLFTVYVGQYQRYAEAHDALTSVRRHVKDAFVAP
jgi:tetratricopeptide (TPR) repeat protein